MFLKINVLRNFAILCNLLKRDSNTGVDIAKFLRTHFFTEHLWTTASEDHVMFGEYPEVSAVAVS